MVLPMGVDLLAILLFETKDELNWWKVAFSCSVTTGIGSDELLFGSNNNLRRNFKDMHNLE